MTNFNNLRFILQNGMHCCNCQTQDPNYIRIGHQTLIDNRGGSVLNIQPGGVINDYIPFYFHPKMPMLYHIFMGLVKDCSSSQEDILYIVSSVERIVELQLPFLFTDRHAYLDFKNVYNKIEDLDQLKWEIIRDDLWHQQYSQTRKEFKQAEFLVHQHVPIAAISGIVVYSEKMRNFVQNLIDEFGMQLQVVVRPNYYYP